MLLGSRSSPSTLVLHDDVSRVDVAAQQQIVDA